MANAVTQVKLSASVQGRRIKVAATGTPGTLIHTTGAPVSTSVYDRLYLNAQNSDTVDRLLTIEFGGTTSPDDLIQVTIPAQLGLVVVVDGDLLAGDGASGVNVRAFAAAANVLTIGGYVMRVTP
jgi:hypothetical protein